MEVQHVMSTNTYSDGTSYKGTYLQGLRHGNGKQTFVDGSTYIGGFSNGLADGLGILTFVNGSQYNGRFAKGRFDGVGKFILPNGDILAGTFDNGKLEGKGIYTTTSRNVSKQGDFLNGKFIRESPCGGLMQEVENTIALVEASVEEFRNSLFSS